MEKSQKPQPRPLLTRWGAHLDRNCPLPEYPRPQLQRAGWTNLNGVWQYAVTDRADLIPDLWEGEIVVPFSPECLLSEVGRQLQPNQYLWYARDISVDIGRGARIVLHFGAVDQMCSVFVNNVPVGGHNGGYWPFSLDITDAVSEGGNRLVVCVFDDTDTGSHAYGKQKLAYGGIWYRPQSGIWQTVWLEYLPETFISGLKITPLYDRRSVELDIAFSDGIEHPYTVTVLDGGTPVAAAQSANGRCHIDLADFRPWTPGDPFLYDVVIESAQDRVQSYFGMRKFSVETRDTGHRCFFLNNEPLFLNGLLDQGYWSDGLYTPPADEAMIYDIAALKELGYNLLRKHIKIEPLRWYYHCDRLGMLVFQDFVNGGGPYHRMITDYLPFIGIEISDRYYRLFARRDERGRAQYLEDLRKTVNLLYNAVSICTWVPFNEGWGQFDANKITERIRNMDATRPVDHASGRHDQRGGDYKSEHVYYKKYRLRADRYGRAQIISEFGGYSCPTPGHMSTDTLFGYKMFQTPDELTSAYENLFRSDVFPHLQKGLCATVYTQVSDVENEINGLFTYDRAVLKMDAERLKKLHRELAGSFHQT